MKTLFEARRPGVLRGREHELLEVLGEARRDLDFWEHEERTSQYTFAGFDAIDPRVRWNLDFCHRRIRALERALAEVRNAGASA